MPIIIINNSPAPSIVNRQSSIVNSHRLPSWLRRPMPVNGKTEEVRNIVNSLRIETICDNADCPNRGECWDKGHAAVLILGNTCTRNCGFCSVPKGRPKSPDADEPARIAEMVKRLGLKYLVITSVNRDDLPDGGAGQFRDCIGHIRKQCPDTRVEILVPDFKDCQETALSVLRQSVPDVFAHNVETVPSLYPAARKGGEYRISLDLLRLAKERLNVPTKSSIMLGLGETDIEVEQTLKDLRTVRCDRITIGQYLKPHRDYLDVIEYVTPEKFDFWGRRAAELGFSHAQSEPFARSSYRADGDSHGKG